jgi:16S rRNA processing protein RimM
MGRMVRVGVVARAHGVRGEVEVRLDEPSSTSLLGQKEVWLRSHGREPEPREVASVRAAHEAVLLRLDGVSDRDAAAALRGSEVLLPRERLPALGEGEHYVADLLGLVARNPAGRVLGKVVEVGGTDEVAVLVVKGAREWQVPMADLFVRRIDVEAGEVVLEPPEEDA